jgi:polyribonucleotide nucleotidyltransferase
MKCFLLYSGLKEKNFFFSFGPLYNKRHFTLYVTKEVGHVGPACRRGLGHGALAQEGLKPVVSNDFRFTIRLTSEVLESNGR